jgi:hypothetical protein
MCEKKTIEMLTSRRNFTAKLIFTAGVAASGAHNRTG